MLYVFKIEPKKQRLTDLARRHRQGKPNLLQSNDIGHRHSGSWNGETINAARKSEGDRDRREGTHG